VTQVLFITGRDQRRYFDFLLSRYLKDATALSADLILPTTVGAPPPADGAAIAPLAPEPRSLPETEQP
jgi:hypothetical protein